MSQIHVEREPGSEVRVPRWALASMAGMVTLSLILAATARLTGMGTVSHPEVPAGTPAALEIVFQPADDGSLAVLSHPDGRTLESLAPGEGGFLRGVLRPLERERVRLEAAAATAPYRLLRSADGSLALQDPATGVLVDLAAFGKTSLSAFQDLLASADDPRVSR